MSSNPSQVYEEDKPAVDHHQSLGPHDGRGSRTTGLQESEYDVKAMTPEGGTYENTIFTATQFCDLGLYVFCFKPGGLRTVGRGAFLKAGTKISSLGRLRSPMPSSA